MSTILFELGTEELPPKNLKTLRDALASHVQTALEQAGIAFTAIKSYAAPRRLALQITGVAERQPDRVEQKRGLPSRPRSIVRVSRPKPRWDLHKG